jgi:uncharacterized membrane protein
MKRNPLIRFWYSLSAVGLSLGTLFFAASLTPSLLPRTFVTQGVLAGCAFIAGYGIGALACWLWGYMELREPRGHIRRVLKWVSIAASTLVAVIFLWRVTGWQNSILELMALEPVSSAHPPKIALIALLTAMILLVIGRLFRAVFHFIAVRVNRFVPRRIANVIGAAAAIALFWSVIDGIIFRGLLRMADASYQQFDELIEPERVQPTDPMKTGSSASLLQWEELGRTGRAYVSSGPTIEDLRAFSGGAAREPIRVYVGLRSRETARERAQLALEELKRAGGFSRSILIVITPTGTGWVDPSGIDSVEYLHGGDVASVALQYSYLSSPLSLFIEPDYGAEAARCLFSEVYGHWTTLPRESRPRLYLHGLSLGALNSEQSAELFELLADPPHGAMWSGPPFLSDAWRALTAGRDPSSPAWLPRFRDGRFARFMNQNGSSVPSDAPWGPMRIVYLQYASDPIVFFEYDVCWKKPRWMSIPRGPDVSPQFTWYPVVTFLQLALDVATASSSAMGHGHVYAPEHYLDAWIAVTGDAGRSPQEIERIRARLSAR